MSAAALFVTGLTTGAFAGGASCAAVQGGLLAGAVGRRLAAEESASASRTKVLVGHPPPEIPAHEADPAPSAPSSIALALRPVGYFLGAKLVSHTLLGAALGLVGSAAQPEPRTRAVMLLVAVGIMVVFALDLLGVKAVRGLVPRAPEAWTRRVRRSTRSESAATPAVLGFLTVLLPCGVTLSVSLLAITSSSPVAGAAVMAGFVLGTSPLFALLGYVFRQSTRVLQGRLSLVTGVVVLVVAAWTANSALTLGGWGWNRDGGPAVESAAAVRQLANGTQEVTLRVSSDGYAPRALVARSGVPTRLLLRTDGTGGCTRSFVIAARGVQEVLPETGTTTVDLGTPRSGTLRYTCGMGMYTGRIEFQAAAPAAGVGPVPADAKSGVRS